MSYADPQRPVKVGFGPRARRLLKQVEETYPHGIHPALVPGIGVEEQRNRYGTDKVVFGVTGALILAFIAWGVISTDSLSAASTAALNWTLMAASG